MKTGIGKLPHQYCAKRSLLYNWQHEIKEFKELNSNKVIVRYAFEDYVPSILNRSN